MSQDQPFDERDVWSLLADELSLLSGMTDAGRLGFAIQLKFRQTYGHYPESISEHPQVWCALLLNKFDVFLFPSKITLFRDDRPSVTDKIFVAIWVSGSPIKTI